MSKGLGKPLSDMGLDALLEDVTSPISQGIQTLPLYNIHPCSTQPRTHFDETALKELTESIQMHGILQPILVKPTIEGYEIIAGERRWRAAKLAGLTDIPALIRETSREEQAALALIENIQRENLSPIEEARALARLIETQNLTQQALANRLGKSRSSLTNLMRLLELPSAIQSLLHQEQISMGHARALLSLPEALRLSVAERIVSEGLSVRDVENMQKTKKANKPSKKHTAHPLLSEHFSTDVTLKANRKGQGQINIPFANPAQLSGILKAIGVEKAPLKEIIASLDDAQ